MDRSAKLPRFDRADFEFVRAIALTFPGTEDGISHENTPSITVRGKLMCRLHDSGEFVPIRLAFDLRDTYLERYPDLFHVPDHFKPYPYICMWVHAYRAVLLTEILELSWRGLASQKQLKAYEAQQKGG